MVVTPIKKTFLTANFIWFLFAMILANIASEMVFALLPVYLTKLNANITQVGLVYTVAAVVPLLLQIFGGWLSDNLGRLRTIAIGSLSAVFGYLIFVLSPTWQWIMVGLCIEFISGSLVGPSFSAYIAEQSSEEQRGRVFGITKSIFMVVTVIGPLAAGFLAYRYSFKLMLSVSFILYAVATFLRIWMATSERFARKNTTEKPTFANFKVQIFSMFGLLFAGGLLTWIWITDAINDTAFNMVGQLFPIYLTNVGGLNLVQVGLLRSLIGGATMLASLLAGWLTDKYSERFVITIGFFLQFAGLVIFLQSRALPVYLIAAVIFGLSTGAFMPAYDSLISKSVPKEKRGLAFGLFGTSLGILSLPMPWIGGQLWDHINPQSPFWVVALAGLLSIPMVLLKFKLPDKMPINSENIVDPFT
jgi:MFS family permease